MCSVWCGIISNLYFESPNICLFLNDLVAAQNACDLVALMERNIPATGVNTFQTLAGTICATGEK